MHSSRKLTIFDNGAGPPKIHSSSRGLELELDPGRASVKLLGAFVHSPPISANFEGGLQALPNGRMFLGYGQRPYFTAFDAHGREVLDAHFTAHTTSYASWNGATRVARWRVLAGRGAHKMHVVAVTAKRGFETAITIRPHADLAVVALDRSGRVLSRSRTVRLR